MSEKKLRELRKYINKLDGYVDFDNYIAPLTPTYVECIYIDDVIEETNFINIDKEYKKYTRI